MNPVTRPRYEWKTIPWRKLEKRVFKLQQRIYQASVRGDVKTVHRLQRLLTKSWSAKCLSVRRVSQDNSGKKTAGVDGVKSLTPTARLQLVNRLQLIPIASPTRRVWIPKPGKDERRPLGILTMHDRALQTLVKLALEPEWEAKFETNSFGFRPGRSCHDAIEAVFSVIKLQPKYALEADIAQCFNRISHSALLLKVDTFPLLERLLRAWLKAGVIDEGQLFPTEEGTPQGGCVSPLLMNIALHGLETSIRQAFPGSITADGKRLQNWKPMVIRYADDFVVLHPDKTVIQQCQQIAAEWLQGMGLELKLSKTRITHTLNRVNGTVGFDFLGVNVRQYRVSKYASKRGYKTLIKPSPEKVKLHYQQLASIVEEYSGASQANLTARLNPLIRGWSNYYAPVVSQETFSRLDNRLFIKLRSWALRRHSQKSKTWVAGKYWPLSLGQARTFAPPQGLKLLSHSETPIQRHIKVQGGRSPYDGDWSYWATRLGKHPDLPNRVATLLKRQQGKCLECGLYFTSDDLLEVHHIDRNHSNHKQENLALVHRHCHDQVHRQQGESSITSGTHDKSLFVEEPCDGKPSSTVLKTSRLGDGAA